MNSMITIVGHLGERYFCTPSMTIVALHYIILNIVLLAVLYSGNNHMVLLATSLVETAGHFPAALPGSGTNPAHP